jgi:hypothetical protein
MKFCFVAGDIGGAKAQAVVAKELLRRGHAIDFVADPSGQAPQFFEKQGFRFQTELDITDSDARVFFISTDSSASGLGRDIARKASEIGKEVVFAADAYINHCFSPWKEVSFGTWFAIDDWHREEIIRIRHGLLEENVRVVGQPLFDQLIDTIPKKAKKREDTRGLLGVKDSEQVVLWWSHGTLDVIAEDILMALTGMKQLEKLNRKVTFIPRFHPKLADTAGSGYIPALKKLLRDTFDESSFIKLLWADSIPPEHLSLSSDVVLTTISFEGAKNVFMGGPPLVRLLGPQNQAWLRELYQKYPFFSDVRLGQSLAAEGLEYVGDKIQEALHPECRKQLASRWKAPVRSVERVCNALVEIANI